MLKNYLKIALRNLIRYKTFSVINIIGLACGIAACSIIYIYVTYEKSYDSFNVNVDNIYRLKNVRYYKSGTDSSAGCIALLGPTLKEKIPEVINFARVRKITALVSVNNRYFNEENIFWADSSFLSMFSYPLVAGNTGKALTDVYSAVITKNTFLKYFGKENPIGKTIRVNGSDFKITGIAENVPQNSHIKFDILLSFHTQFTEAFCWGCNNNNTYIQVLPGTKKSAIEAKLATIIDILHDRQKDGFKRSYFLQPLKDIHLYSNLRTEHEKNGNAKTVYFLSLAVILILLIAWINYINLSTARSIDRAKEVGLRKVVGAGYWSLIRQFLIESFLINLTAVFISFFIIEISRPYWIELTGLPASFSFWKHRELIVLFAFILFISPVTTGFYPALVLASYSPVSILKGNFKNTIKGILLRKVLVIFQFTISIILIVVIIIFEQQLSFMRNKNLGFDIKQKLVINTPTNLHGDDLTNFYNTFINELKNYSLIEDATFSSIIPGTENNDVSGGVRPGEAPIEKGKQVYFVYIAQNYLDFFNVHSVCGRNFFESDFKEKYDNKKAVIVNESAVKALGFKSNEKALGSILYQDDKITGNIVGVIKDYHQQSLEKEIKPVIFECAARGNYFIFDIKTKNLAEKIETIKNIYTIRYPGNPFEYKFLDEYFNRQYRSNIKTTELFRLFTFLSIFISCLGLIGLTSLLIIHKTKEMGIRKVLGASVPSLLTFLSKEFVKWLFISNVIAWPVAYYAMNKWLQNFAYRINVGWWMFILAGGMTLVIALVTISFQAVKAATANPVDSLKYE